jgi:glycosyltransferase involved in cell wall biosynthesis
MSNKISVIIPTYNRSSYVLDTIHSVVAQDYDNIEIIVIDDGSTDDTRDKLASLIDNEIIQYIYQKNRGRSAARNKGISLATGEYLTFLDSDDLFETGKSSRQVRFFSEHPEVGLVHGGYIKFDDEQNNLGYRNPSWFSGWIYPEMLLQWYTLLATPTVMVPKLVLDEVGGFHEDLYIGEDLDLWRRIARKYPFGYINQCLARIRVHAGNTSTDALRVTPEFERYLDRAFEDDRSLSNRFKHRALSRMYSNRAYIMLSDKEKEILAAARTNARLAIFHDPLNMNGFMALISSMLGYNTRKMLAEKWRSLRNRLMVPNQNGSSRS